MAVVLDRTANAVTLELAVRTAQATESEELLEKLEEGKGKRQSDKCCGRTDGRPRSNGGPSPPPPLHSGRTLSLFVTSPLFFLSLPPLLCWVSQLSHLRPAPQLQSSSRSDRESCARGKRSRQLCGDMTAQHGGGGADVVCGTAVEVGKKEGPLLLNT